MWRFLAQILKVGRAKHLTIARVEKISPVHVSWGIRNEWGNFPLFCVSWPYHPYWESILTTVDSFDGRLLCFFFEDWKNRSAPPKPTCVFAFRLAFPRFAKPAYGILLQIADSSVRGNPSILPGLRGEDLNYKSVAKEIWKPPFLAPDVQWALKVYRVCSIHVFFKCFEPCPYLVCHVTTIENV